MSPDLTVGAISDAEAARGVVAHPYLHRKPNISLAFGLYLGDRTMGVVTFGCPPSRHLQAGVCPDNPGAVIELNRLWVSDELGRNSESWFVARALRLCPARIVVS